MTYVQYFGILVAVYSSHNLTEGGNLTMSTICCGLALTALFFDIRK